MENSLCFLGKSYFYLGMFGSIQNALERDLEEETPVAWFLNTNVIVV
jgi:hypothetical protein